MVKDLKMVHICKDNPKLDKKNFHQQMSLSEMKKKWIALNFYHCTNSKRKCTRRKSGKLVAEKIVILYLKSYIFSREQKKQNTYVFFFNKRGVIVVPKKLLRKETFSTAISTGTSFSIKDFYQKVHFCLLAVFDF